MKEATVNYRGALRWTTTSDGAGMSVTCSCQDWVAVEPDKPAAKRTLYQHFADAHDYYPNLDWVSPVVEDENPHKQGRR